MITLAIIIETRRRIKEALNSQQKTYDSSWIESIDVVPRSQIVHNLFVQFPGHFQALAPMSDHECEGIASEVPVLNTRSMYTVQFTGLGRNILKMSESLSKLHLKY